MSGRPPGPATILVTGAQGNLGRKVIEAFARTGWCRRIVGLDLSDDPSGFSADAQARLRLVAGDLAVPEADWRGAFDGVDALVHFAARDPSPYGGWGVNNLSIAMTTNVLIAAREAGLSRAVYASSNHAMGAYKDPPLSDGLQPGGLRTDLEPGPGTRWHDGTERVHSIAYGASKVVCERLFASFAENSGGRMTSVSARVGWTQPGENRPETISHSGVASRNVRSAMLSDEDRRALRWYRNMWLSNGDLARLFIAAVQADASGWEAPAIIVNGVSNNAGTDWDLSAGRRLIGYEPQDDLYAALPPSP